jgi:protein transport protein HofC
MLPALLLVAAGVGYYIGWPNVRASWLTRWFPRFDAPDILRNLSEAVANQTPLSTVLPILTGYHHRPHVRERLTRVELAVEGGSSAWQALLQEGIIRRREAAVLESAQRVGNLPWALSMVADRIDTRHQYLVQWWFEVLRPWLVIAIGLVVAFICIGMFMPLIKLINDLS